MKKPLIWFAAQVLSVILVVSCSFASCYEFDHEGIARTKVPKIRGFVGCLHEDVCTKDETCFDDGLFGKCLNEEKAEFAQLKPDELSPAQLDLIKSSSPLFLKNSWSSLSTQCNIRALILAIRLGLPPSSLIDDSCLPSEFEQIEEDAPSKRKFEPEIYSKENDFAEYYDFPLEGPSFIIGSEEKETKDGKVEGEKLLWLDSEDPITGQEEIVELDEPISSDQNLYSDSIVSSLEPAEENDQIESIDSPLEEKPELLKRTSRFADSNAAVPMQDLDKREDEANAPSLTQKGSSKINSKILLIAVSVTGCTMFVVLAIGATLCYRKYKQNHSRGNRLKLNDDCEEEKCEKSDILGPLVTEAKKSAQNIIAGASDYISNFSKKKDLDSQLSGKTLTKQASNTSLASNCSSLRTNSTSSWSGEPPKMDINITTGHLILSYLEKHLNDRNRLEEDWRSICAYEADEAVICEAATRQGNLLKNRPGATLPYEQSRVKLRRNGADYINASLIYDHEPRNPAYILTQTPMESTMKDFWQMVWEQSSVIIVSLDRADSLVNPESVRVIDDPSTPVQYWPNEGWQLCGHFEVHLVSEHMWCGADYVVRSFYLKNLETNETRTVTQFHFLVWPLGKPTDVVNTMLEFRRRVNKSFRGKCSPIVIHCPDGTSASGTYLLLDLVLNRIQRGIKELDISATLEHLRDQRQGVVQTKDEFEFVLSAVAEEVNALLKTAGGATN